MAKANRSGTNSNFKLIQRPGKGKLLSSDFQRLESLDKPVSSLTGDEDANCWAPKLSTAFMTLLSARYCCALWSNISDCDETFNYWEPAHYLLYGSGFQTWEYSPRYAIRSYAYLLPHTLPGVWQKYFHGKEDKIIVFYLMRVILALLCAAAEVFFYRGVKQQFGNHVARMLLFCLVFGSGMHISAAAFLPSSFAMVMIMLSYGGWFIGDYSIAIFFIATAALVGWPFSALMGVPIAWDLVFKRKRITYFIQWSAISFVSLMCPLVYFDSHYYGKTVFAPFNIIRYNIFGKGGPNLYGKEPWTYYFVNGFLNFNVIFLLALVSLPAFILVQFFTIKLYEKDDKRLELDARKDVVRPSKTKAYFPPRVLLCLVGLYLWILVFFTRPHKEERFLFPIYPVICLAGAVTLSSTQSAYSLLCRRIQIKMFASHWIVIGTLFVFALFSVSRSLALYFGYHAPMDVYLQLNRLTNKERAPSSKLSAINLCVGKEWYRFPSSFFLPEGWRLQFIRSEFRAQLPKPYSRYANATRIIPSNMNDENREEDSRYIPVASCHYLVDLDTSRESVLEPNYAKKTNEWTVVFARPFLDSSRSPPLFRAFYIPFLSLKFNVYSDYVLLKSKSRNKKKRKDTPSVRGNYELDGPEEFEGVIQIEENEDELEE